MKVKRKIIFLFLLLFAGDCCAQIDSNVFKYYPLNVNNRWTWYRQQSYFPGSGYESKMIVDTQVINNRFYFKVKDDSYTFYTNQHTSYFYFCRIDSLTGNLYGYDTISQTECLMDSLNAKKGDSTLTCDDNWWRCDTGTYYIFNQSPATKIFLYTNYFEVSGNRKLAKNFGLVYQEGRAMYSTTFWFLRGCVINSVLFGDTTFPVGINQISAQTPETFSLFQNYPNPFNPSTKIKFTIPPSRGARGVITLNIYDVLGREVATLVNEQLSPGTYEVEWDGTNYSSGIYYYCLVTSKFVETKKMVLIK
jgi:hypothetical protein